MTDLTEAIQPILYSGRANRDSRLREIDSLRGIAAAWVAVFHFTAGVGYIVPADQVVRIAPFSINIEGLSAVDLFFVISGFVIFMTLERCRKVSDFAISRFARLYPAYWFALFLTTLVALTFPVESQMISAPQVVANTTMAQAFIGYGPIDSVYWSLAYELAFYVIMAGVFAAGWLDRIEIVGAVWLTGSVLLLQFAPPLASHIPWRVQTALVLPYIPLFLAGILFYRIRHRGMTFFRLLLLFACLAARVLALSGPMTVLTIGIFTIFPLAVWERLALLRWRPLVFLGFISYPVYLLHQSIGNRIEWLAADFAANRWIGFFVAFGVVILLSTCVSLLVERPAQRYIRRIFAPPRIALARAPTGCLVQER
jgi:peptidoglycan/LPS O-acetylase OafA/YrhL